MKREVEAFLTVFALVAAVAVIFWLAAGCVGPSSPETPLRAQERAAIMAIAGGVVAADHTCAVAARGRHDLALAERCGHAYQLARRALLVAEVAIDDGHTASASCNAAEGVTALRELVAITRESGVDLPPAIVDGLDMASALARLVPCGLDDGGAT